MNLKINLMAKKSIFTPALLLALIQARDTKPGDDYGSRDGQPCLVVDVDHIVMYEDHRRYGDGGWIDDG